MDRTAHIVRGFKATLVARAIYMASSALLLVLLAGYLLDPDGYGLLYWVIGVLAVVQLVVDLGIGKSTARYVAEYRERDPGQVPHLLRTAIGYKLVLIGIVGVTLFLVASPLARLLGEPAAAPFFVAGVLFVIVTSFDSFAQIVFQGYNRLEYSAAIRAISGVSRLVFVIAFVLLGLGALGAFFGYIVGYAVAAGVGLTLVYDRIYRRHDPAAVYEDGLARRMAVYSLPLTATRGANVIDKQLDIVLVGIILNPVAVAFYTLSKQIVDFVLAPAEALGFTISPNFGEQKAAGDLLEARRLYETALENVLVVYVPAAVGLALVAEPAITLIFGTDYAGAVVVLQVLCAYVVLMAITNLTSDSLDYLGRARARAVAKGVTSVVNVGLTVALLPVFGVVGAAVATVFTHAIYVAVNLYIVHSELELHLRDLGRTVGSISLVAAVMATAVAVVVPLASSLLELGVVIAVGGGVWALLIVSSGLVDPKAVRSVLG